MSNDEVGVSISIPRNLILSQYDYIIVTTILLRKGLLEMDTEEKLMSDSLIINTYYANDPLAINSKYDISPIIVKDLVDPILMVLPYK